MEFHCPSCGLRLQIDARLSGIVGQCRRCGAKFAPGRVAMDLERTVPLRTPGVPMSAFAAAAAVAAIAVAVAVWLAMRPAAETSPPTVEARIQPEPEPEPAPTPVASIPQAPPQSELDIYAVELAAAYTQTAEPAPALCAEFRALFQTMQRLYGRSTPLQLRDAVYQVAQLQAYGRPDITILSAARMIADWAPPGYPHVSVAQLMLGRPVKVSPETMPSRDVPVSRAVQAITDEIVGAYNEAVEAYQAQHQEILQQREIARQEKAAAAAEARAAANQRAIEFQQQLQDNSVMGQFWQQ